MAELVKGHLQPLVDSLKFNFQHCSAFSIVFMVFMAFFWVLLFYFLIGLKKINLYEKMNTALQLFNGELTLITKPLPKLSSPKDVMIKVTYSGICGTDLSIIKGDFPAAKKIIQGHEFSGVIHEVGDAVKHLKVGDRYQKLSILTVCQFIFLWCHANLRFHDYFWDISVIAVTIFFKI